MSKNFYKDKFYKQKRANKRLKEKLDNKDAIIKQYQALYKESQSALKLAKKSIPTNADDLNKI